MKKDKVNTGSIKAPDVEQPPVRTLVSSDDQLRFMAEVMPHKIFTVTALGTIDYLNPKWYEYSGFDSESLRGEAWRKIVHPEDMPATEAAWMHTLRTGDPLSIEHRLRRHDGVYRWHISRSTIMHDISGNAVKWFGSSADIHDSKLAERRERRLTTRTVTLAKQREKLLALNAAKDEFISLASHQLRTPATVVKQYLSMVLDGYVGKISPELRNMLERANASNDRQIDIVDDLLEVARVDAGKVNLVKTEVNLVPLVQEVINEHDALIQDRQQKVHLNYLQPGISAPIDRSRMKMVIENILDNASKYSPENTRIDFEVSQQDDTVSIAVIDQGVGIARGDHTKLFGKFSRLNNPLSISVGGTGLGLYWAKRIVTLHGGRIKVTSKLGEGSTFTVTLPKEPTANDSKKA